MKQSRTPKCEHANSNSKEKEGIGEMVAVKGSMKPALKEPCVECPLRRDAVPGYLGGYTPSMYVELLHGPASVACHLSPGFQEGEISKQRHCTGVAAYRANVDHVCEVYGYTTMAQTSTELVGKDDRFFESPEEFVAYHEGHQVKAGDPE